ncbi:2528_t:CDS:2 [Funneliformis mosseae]|uniref:2528_t:CDS:1 n=1 Tax=Funneliformis mosseae TaxID=27381 RepID=A0A9N9BT87_FUNMO|nr:2528_t:CDS:2 [Funneliformis mosseae]
MEDKFWPEIINDLKLLLETKSNQDVVLDPENGVETLNLLITSNEFGLHKLSQHQEILRAHMLPGSAKTAPKSFRNYSDVNSIESVSTTEPIRRQSLIKIDSTIITTQHATKFSTECFLYSFADYNKLETGTIGRVKSHGCSVRCYKDWGPIFGNYEGGNDLVMKRKTEWKSKPVSYPNINIPKKFNCSDYEVFQVKKKA